MKKFIRIFGLSVSLMLNLAADMAMAQTYTTAYTDGGNAYFSPAVKGVTRNNAQWPTSNLSFSNLSAVTGVKGRVGMTLSNVTTTGAYTVNLKDSTGAWRYFQLYHGSDATGGVTILPFQGNISWETLTQGVDVHVVHGDSVSLPYSIGKDLSGWTLWFGAKASLSASTYVIPLREVTSGVTDLTTGTGIVNLSIYDTTVPARRYFAELEMRKPGDVKTVLKFYLWIDQDVIQ